MRIGAHRRRASFSPVFKCDVHRFRDSRTLQAWIPSQTLEGDLGSTASINIDHIAALHHLNLLTHICTVFIGLRQGKALSFCNPGSWRRGRRSEVGVRPQLEHPSWLGTRDQKNQAQTQKDMHVCPVIHCESRRKQFPYREPILFADRFQCKGTRIKARPNAFQRRSRGAPALRVSDAWVVFCCRVRVIYLRTILDTYAETP